MNVASRRAVLRLAHGRVRERSVEAVGRERVGELCPGADVELLVGVAEVELDRLRGDEQGLCDLASGEPSAARSATRRSLGVSASTPLRMMLRGWAPVAASSVRAWKAIAAAPPR